MDERFQPGKAKGARQEKNTNYSENIEGLIGPFVLTKDDAEKLTLSSDIATVLDSSDEEMLKKLRSDDVTAVVFSEMVRELSKALKSYQISNQAPWFKTFADKILTFELFTANASGEMDLQKGANDREAIGRRLLEKFEKMRKENPDQGGPDDKKKE